MIDAVFYMYIYSYKLLKKTPPHLHGHFLQTIMNFTAKKKKHHDISEVGAIPLLSGMLESDQVLHVSTVRTNLNDHG